MKNLNYIDSLPNYADIISKSKIKNTDKIIDNLINDGIFIEDAYVIGRFCATDQNFAFVIPLVSGACGDVFIPPKMERDAFHNDTVLVKILKKRGKKFEGEICLVLSRFSGDIAAPLQKSRSFLFIEPKKFPPIAITGGLDAKVGDVVTVKISNYGDKEFMPSGNITGVLGKDGSRTATINSILHSYDIPLEFDANILNDAQNFEISDNDFKNRVDLRDDMIFTIDGEYSKDFDDAISLEITENGYKLSVHIADVSHYVTLNSPLDLEAFSRGTSVYFADKVIPMLPFALSNEICSLKPNEDRLTFSAFINLNKNGEVIDFNFAKTVINSKYRFTYTQVNDILSGKLPHPQKDLLTNMNSLAKKMKNIRINRGALEFDLPEYQTLCDKTGKPIAVELKTRGDSEKLIEEFMLAANESAARLCHEANYPAVYRIHNNPDSEKLEVFKKFATIFGYKAPTSDKTSELESVLKQAQGTKYHKILQTMLLRSLSRARYSEQCLGHYGLQSEFYLHFTSPIRRYPDLASHRMIEKVINKTKFNTWDSDYCKSSSLKSSKRETLADNASRDINKCYIAEYMEQFVSQEFSGTITSIVSSRVFIEIMNCIEGFINITDFKENYVYDADTISYIASDKTLSLGDTINVRLVSANKTDGKIIFFPL